MKKFLIATLVTVAALIIAALLFRRYSKTHTSAPKGVTLSFLGLTNVPTKGNYAVFMVTNTGPERVSFDADALEYRSGQGWVTNSLRNTTRINWLYWYHDLAGRLGGWHDFGGDLEPGSSAIFGAPVVITNSVWRLRFHCVEQSTGVQRIIDRTGDLGQHTLSVITNGDARNQMIFNGRQYDVVSPEFTP